MITLPGLLCAPRAIVSRLVHRVIAWPVFVHFVGGSMIPACPSFFIFFFYKGHMEGINSLKICVWSLYDYVSFVVCLWLDWFRRFDEYSLTYERSLKTWLVQKFSTDATAVGMLRTQKLKSPLLRKQSLKVLSFQPGVGEYIAVHATLTARDFFLTNFYRSGPFICTFSKTAPEIFLC